MSSTEERIVKLLHDVIAYSQEAIDTCAPLSRDEFADDRVVQHAVAYAVIVLGEALRQAERLDPTLADDIPDLRDVVDTRKCIVHGYESVNVRLLWDIVADDLPPFTELVAEAIERRTSA